MESSFSTQVSFTTSPHMLELFYTICRIADIDISPQSRLAAAHFAWRVPATSPPLIHLFTIAYPPLFHRVEPGDPPMVAPPARRQRREMASTKQTGNKPEWPAPCKGYGPVGVFLTKKYDVPDNCSLGSPAHYTSPDSWEVGLAFNPALCKEAVKTGW